MWVSIILILVLLTAGELYAANGAEVAKRCNECHGPNGHSEEPDVPAIGGFSAYAILDLLESFRIGDRPAHPHEDADGIETDMKEISESLSAEEAQAVADYYAAQSWQPRE